MNVKWHPVRFRTVEMIPVRVIPFIKVLIYYTSLVEQSSKLQNYTQQRTYKYLYILRVLTGNKRSIISKERLYKTFFF